MEDILKKLDEIIERRENSVLNRNDYWHKYWLILFLGLCACLIVLLWN